MTDRKKSKAANVALYASVALTLCLFLLGIFRDRAAKFAFEKEWFVPFKIICLIDKGILERFDSVALLRMAIRRNRTDLALFILSRMPKEKVDSIPVRSTLNIAVLKNNFVIVKKLLELELNPNDMDIGNYDFLDYARDYQLYIDKEIIDILSEYKKAFPKKKHN